MRRRGFLVGLTAAAAVPAAALPVVVAPAVVSSPYLALVEATYRLMLMLGLPGDE